MSTAAPPEPTKTADVRRVLPDDTFWRRYSPQHEFSLSSVSSFALHLLILGLAAFACMIPFFNRDDSPVELNSIMIGDNGGKLDGDERSRGQNADPDGQPIPADEKPAKLPQVPKANLPADAQPKVTPLPEAPETGPDRTIKEINEFFEQGGKRAKDHNKTRGPDGKPPKGDGPGDSGGKILSISDCRRIRWTMRFNTRDGRDYARQLQSLGATVAVELPNKPTKMTVYRDLTSPANGEVEETKAIHRIWWIDDNAASVSALFAALKIKSESKRLIAFFPAELEEKLLKLELAYANGKSEDQILETEFELQHKGKGRFEPVVIRQR
jgi:hypothetical protein